MEFIDTIPEKEQYLLRAKAAIYLDRGYDIDGVIEAIAILKEMENAYPDDKDMLLLLGGYVGQDSLAIHYLERLLAIDPTNELAQGRLVDRYFNSRNFEKARTLIEEIIKKKPYAYTELADYYALTDRLEDGVNHLRKAWELDSDNSWIPNSIAGLYSLFDEYDEAEKVLLEMNRDRSYDTQPRLGGSERSWTFGATWYPYTGRYRKALEVADEAIKWCLENNEVRRSRKFPLVQVNSLYVRLGG